MNGEAIAGLRFILTKYFDVIHQWICLNELYKLMQSFFSNFQFFFEFLAKT